MKLRYLALFLLILSVSCSVEDDFLEPDAEITFGIRHDRSLSQYENAAASSNPNLPDFSSVVAFEYSLDGSPDRDFTASGVIIDDEWILTAAHNFYDAEEQASPAPSSGVVVKVGNDPNTPDATYTVAEIILHPTWLAGSQNYDNANDLCLVRTSAVISNVTPASLYEEDNEQTGAIVWHCGFGNYSSLAGQDPELESKKHAIENTLDRSEDGFRTSAGGVNYFGGLLAFDFDNPAGTINALGDDIVNEDEGYLGPGTSSSVALELEGTTVTGDSGGPLFLDNSGEWQVAGILSGGAFEPIRDHIDGNYGDISIYTRVSTSRDWILSVIQ
ncbi:MAG: trypsin-like serine protease [Mameliella sp.]|nr:trypsin-like serine protease [Phaeodactylibacter sp.]